MTRPIYAIGDIHGQHDMLLDALTLIEADGGPRARVVFLGDLVDRGPDSRGVLETLIAGLAQGRDWIVLRGNHDQMFLDYLDTCAPGDASAHPADRLRSGARWLEENIGGKATLASYGVDTALPSEQLCAAARAAVPPEHVAFLRARPFYYLEDGFLFVHAGIAPGVPLEEQGPEQFLWIRGPFLSHEQPFPWLVIHGHTSINAPRHYGNRVNLDGGAGWGRPLTAAAIENGGVYVLTPRGRVPLHA